MHRGTPTRFNIFLELYIYFLALIISRFRQKCKIGGKVDLMMSRFVIESTWVKMEKEKNNHMENKTIIV